MMTANEHLRHSIANGRPRRIRRAIAVLCGLSLLTISACRSTDDWTASWNQHTGNRPEVPRKAADPHPRQMAAVRDGRSAGDIPPSQTNAAAGSQSGIKQAGYQQPVPAPPGPSPAVVPGVTQPRIPLPQMSPEEYARAELLAQGGPTVVYPDEYLFDGGDRALPIHYGEFRRHGLNTEDAVVEYSDHLGDRKVKPTNRVAVYAPRFAAVRTISIPSAGIGASRVGSFDEGVAVTGMAIRTGTAGHKGRLVPDAARVRSRGSGIDGELRSAVGLHRTRSATHAKRVIPIENLAFIKAGLFERTEKAVLAKGIQAAAVWSKRQFPVAVARTRKSVEISARVQFEEFIGREPMLKQPGKLRVVKLADKKAAKPGEVITFTIRYDNLGERELLNMRILDNLTPRLEYVEDSAESDRRGRLVIEDNQEGSIVLKFEMFDPLPGGKGGVVTFKAKVR